MQFQPKDEATLEKEKAELAAKRIMKYGTVCDCEVLNSEDEISKVKPDGTGGNEMIHLTLKVFTPDGEEKTFDDYIIASMEFKLRHAADTFGILHKYESGSLVATDFYGKSGKCKMGIQRDKGGQYPDKNVITDYIKREKQPVIESVATGALIDDEIPF